MPASNAAAKSEDVPAVQAASWHWTNLSADVDAPRAGKGMVGFRLSGDTDSRIYYLSKDGNPNDGCDQRGRVIELAYYQGGWHEHDITGAAGAP